MISNGIMHYYCIWSAGIPEKAFIRVDVSSSSGICNIYGTDWCRGIIFPVVVQTLQKDNERSYVYKTRNVSGF